MPVASGDTSQLELMKALLQQKGLLATGGNIRSLPFSDEGSSSFSPSSDGGSGGTGPETASAAATRPPGATPLIKDGQLIDPNTKAPLQGDIAGDWWKYLLAGAGIAGGSLLGAAMMKRRVPGVEGEVITDPLAAVPEGEVVNGEYTDVPDQARLTHQPAPIAGSDIAGVLADRSKQLNARNRPRANPVPETTQSRITLPDAMNDIAPEEIENAKALVQQLIANRQRGNQIRANQSRLTRRAGPPTGPVDADAENSLLNTIIRIMREQGASKIARAVP